MLPQKHLAAPKRFAFANSIIVVKKSFTLNYFRDAQQESDYAVHEQIDLYDDVISPSANNGDAPEDRDYLDTLPTAGGSDGGKSSQPNVVYTYTGKRIALYIGNLTWVGILRIWLRHSIAQFSLNLKTFRTVL